MKTPLKVKQIFKDRMPEILLSIKHHVEANRSDPFAGNRAACHFRSGIADLGDYSSERLLREELVLGTKPEIYRTVVVHSRQKRP